MDSVQILLGLLFTYSGATSTTTWSPPSSTYDCGSTWLTAINTDRELTSPGYPFVYPNNLSCTWNIEAADADSIVAVEVVSSSIEASDSGECINDAITAYDGTKSSSWNLMIKQWCGTETPTINSTGRSMTLNFTTNHAVVGKGFKLRYHQIPGTTTSRPWTCGRRHLAATEEARYLTSPGYPGDYRRNLDCEWTIVAPDGTVIKLVVLDAKLEGISCVFDAVEVYDGFTTIDPLLGRFCGLNRPTYTSSSNNVMVRFKTDSTNEFRGFKMSYQSGRFIEPTTCGLLHLTATGEVRYLTSPGYPNNYTNNIDCHWTITAITGSDIQLIATDVDLERYGSHCAFDVVKIYDGHSTLAPLLGSFCGKHQQTFVSSSTDMSVVFKTDTTIVSRGFRLSYQSRNFRATEPPSENIRAYSSTGAIIGGVGGGFPLLCFISCIAMCLGKKGRKTQRPAYANPGLASASQPPQQLYCIGGSYQPTGSTNPSSIATSPYAQPPSYDQLLANGQILKPDAPPPPYSTVASMSQPSYAGAAGSTIDERNSNDVMAKPPSLGAGNIHAVAESNAMTGPDRDPSETQPVHRPVSAGVVIMAGPAVDTSGMRL